MPISDQTIAAIQAETVRAETLHPVGGLVGPTADPVRAVAILAEEVGEMAAEILEATRPESRIPAEDSWRRAEKEAIEAATTAARIVDLIATRRSGRVQ